MNSNILLGGVRIRQLRAAQNHGCKIPNQLHQVAPSCYSHNIDGSDEDKSPFGPPDNPTKYHTFTLHGKYS